MCPFCPGWIWTNAGGTGYHLSSLAPGQARSLWPHLGAAERLALATDLRMLARRGDVPLDEALALVTPLARDPDRLQVEASLLLLGLVEPNQLGDREHLRYQAFLRRTYGERSRKIGWLPRQGDDAEARPRARPIGATRRGSTARSGSSRIRRSRGRRWIWRWTGAPTCATRGSS